MITRRQARLLGLTDGEGASPNQSGVSFPLPSPSTKKSEAALGPRPALPSRDALPRWASSMAVQHCIQSSLLQTTLESGLRLPSHRDCRMHLPEAENGVVSGETPDFDLPLPQSLQSAISPRQVRLSPAQVKNAWRCVVRDLTMNSLHGRRYESAAGQPPRIASLSPQVEDEAPRNWTMRRWQLARKHHFQHQQPRLLEDFRQYNSLKAHEERMRLLLQEGKDEAEREAAYLQSLDQNSSREANVLHVISAIDAEFRQQFVSVYGAAPSTSGQRAPGAGLLVSAVEACIAEAVHRVKAFSAMLMPYQQEGVRWMLQLNMMERANGLMADDMGLGKTAQTVVYLACYKVLVEEVVEVNLRKAQEMVRSGMRVNESEDPFIFQLGWDHNSDPLSNRAAIAVEALRSVRRWIWRLTVAEEEEEEEATRCRRAAALRESKPGTTRRAAADSPIFIPRKRGRPPKNPPLPSALPTPDVAAAHLKVDSEGCCRPMRPVLILAPLSTLPHWKSEFSHFGVADGFRVYVLNGSREDREARMTTFLEHVRWRDAPWGEMDGETNASKRRRIAATMEAEDGLDEITRHGVWTKTTPVLVVPHDLLARKVLGVQRKIPCVSWQIVVMDEAQRIKNAQASLFQKACQLESISRLVLTGTPLQNNIAELFSLLQFLAPNSFHTKRQSELLERLDDALTEASNSNELEDRELHMLLCRRVHRLLTPFVLRRDKGVLKGMLPEKKDVHVICPVLPYQVSKMREIEERYRLGQLGGNPSIQLRKALLHPYTLLPYFYIDEDVVWSSGKLLVLDFMMHFLLQTKHKFLVFCCWTLVLDVVEALCGYRKIPYVRLDGRTSVEQREANIQLFNAREGESSAAPANGTSGPCCFLISKVAGGVGLNLQAADTVFMLDVDYNPQRDHQALSRVYRVGQTKEVRVFRLVVDHPVERSIVAIHQSKDNLDQAVVQAGKYDLHSSATDREHELQRVFDHRIPKKVSGALGGDDASRAEEEEDVDEVAEEENSSPNSPATPMYFGPNTPPSSSPSCASERLVASPVDASNTTRRYRRVTFAEEDDVIEVPPRTTGDTPVPRRGRPPISTEKADDRAPPPPPSSSVAPEALSAENRHVALRKLVEMQATLREILPRGEDEELLLERHLQDLEQRCFAEAKLL